MTHRGDMQLLDGDLAAVPPPDETERSGQFDRGVERRHDAGVAEHGVHDHAVAGAGAQHIGGDLRIGVRGDVDSRSRPLRRTLVPATVTRSSADESTVVTGGPAIETTRVRRAFDHPANASTTPVTSSAAISAMTTGVPVSRAISPGDDPRGHERAGTGRQAEGPGVFVGDHGQIVGGATLDTHSAAISRPAATVDVEPATRWANAGTLARTTSFAVT